MAKKMVDTWKTKRWYTILAPKIFNEVEVSQVPAQDDEHLINRVIEIPLKDITKDMAHLYTAVRLRVFDVKGNTARTKFIGHSLAREYLQTLARRYRDKLDVVFPLKSKDGIHFRLKAVIVTAERCSQKQKRTLHNQLIELVTGKAQETEFATFMLDIIYGKLSAELQGALKTIAPLRRVEIRKSELTEWFDTETNMPLPAPPAQEGAAPAETMGGGSATSPILPEAQAPAEQPSQAPEPAAG